MEDREERLYVRPGEAVRITVIADDPNSAEDPREEDRLVLEKLHKLLCEMADIVLSRLD